MQRLRRSLRETGTAMPCPYNGLTNPRPLTSLPDTTLDAMFPAGRENGNAVHAPSGAAAFFDVDGTLFALPTLERRFLRELHRRGQIPMTNALAWLVEAARLLSGGIEHACYANKALLRGISCELTREAAQAAQQSVCCFPQMIERLVWHARRGDAIVLLTGTLRELADWIARRIEKKLDAAGCKAGIFVCATELERRNASWSGRVRGNVVRGKEKGVALRKLGAAQGWQLADSWAYGDSASDRWMLEAVGHPVAVNPAPMLARLARKRGWPVLGKSSGFREGSEGDSNVISRQDAPAHQAMQSL